MSDMIRLIYDMNFFKSHFSGFLFQNSNIYKSKFSDIDNGLYDKSCDLSATQYSQIMDA